MKEHTDDLLVTQIIGICWQYSRTIEEITSKIYKNQYAKNIVRVYQCCEVLLSHGVMVPKFKNRKLMFQVDQETLKK